MADGDPVAKALALVLGHHSDAFNPIRTRPNDFSLTYGILRCLNVGSLKSASRRALKLFFLTEGPSHCKSTSWFDDLLVEQVVAVYEDGFQATWLSRTVNLSGQWHQHQNRF